MRPASKDTGLADRLDRAVRATLVIARSDAGLTQRALAAQLGRPHSFAGKIENGTRRTTVVDFVLIAHALQANPAELLARAVRSAQEEARAR